MKRNANEFEQIASDLKIDKASVELYFSEYDLLKRYPIRDLTFTELSFAKALERLQTKTNGQIQIMLSDFGISLNDYKADMAVLPKAMAHFDNEQDYLIMTKYQDILLQPYLLYGNQTASMLSVITKQGLALLLTNLAVGVPMNPNEQISAGDRLSATQKIIDILNEKVTLKESILETKAELDTSGTNELRRLLNNMPLTKLKALQTASAIQVAEPVKSAAEPTAVKVKRKYVRHKPTKAMILAAQEAKEKAEKQKTAE